MLHGGMAVLQFPFLAEVEVIYGSWFKVNGSGLKNGKRIVFC